MSFRIAIKIFSGLFILAFIVDAERSPARPIQRASSRGNSTLFNPQTTNRSLVKEQATSTRNVVCYYANYAATGQAGKTGGSRLLVNDIDPFLCTHIIYGPLGFNEKLEPESEAPEVDYEEDGGLGSIKRLNGLKQVNKELKTLVSIGGHQVYSGSFSSMASKPKSRAAFAKRVDQFLDKHELDGVDIDWQFPAKLGGDSTSDKENFVALLRDLRSVLEPGGRLLSAQVSGRKAQAEGYDIRRLSEQLDLINLLAYGYDEEEATRTQMLAPIFAPKGIGLATGSEANVNWSVNYWLTMGASADKINLAISLRGQDFKLEDADLNGFNEPASRAAGPSSPSATNQLGYNEICALINRQPGQWTVVPDRLNQAHAYNRGTLRWFGFEDVKSVGNKVIFARHRNLAGVMINGLHLDDHSGRCHRLRFPLTKAAKLAINGQFALRPDISPGRSQNSLNQSLLQFPLPVGPNSEVRQQAKNQASAMIRWLPSIPLSKR